MTRIRITTMAALLSCVATGLAAQARSGTAEIAFIANSGEGTIALLDVATRSIIGKLDINPSRTRATGPGAANYAQDTDISPDGRTLYVSRAYLGDVAAFDIGSGKQLWATPLNTGRADHMTISKDGAHLFVSAMLDNRLYRVATTDGKVMGHLVTGVYPHDNKVSADGTLLYNTSIGALATLPRAANAPPLTETPGAQHQLTIIAVGSFTILERVPTGFAIRPWQFAPQEAGMYVQLANEHAIGYFDLGTRSVTRRVELPVKPGIVVTDYDFEAPHHGLAISDDGRTLCAAGRASDYAALVSAPAFELLATIPVGDAPGWAESADGGRLCLVTNTRSDDLSIISIAERREIARLPIGDGPKHVTIARIPASVIAAFRAR
jgi:DNA-binding beta-propeller fold protein YncE